MKMSAPDLHAMLIKMADFVLVGHSFEGRISYAILEQTAMEAESDAPAEFEVQGAFRTGNRDGQGGTALVGSSDAPAVPVPEGGLTGGERLQMVLEEIRAVAVILDDQHGTFPVDLVRPETAYAFGELEGIASKLGNLLSLDLERHREAAARKPVLSKLFLAMLERAMLEEHKITLRVTNGGELVGQIIDMTDEGVVLKQARGAIIIPYGDIAGYTWEGE